MPRVIYIYFRVEWEAFTCYPVQASHIEEKFCGEHNDIAEQRAMVSSHRGQRFIQAVLPQGQDCMNYQNQHHHFFILETIYI